MSCFPWLSSIRSWWYAWISLPQWLLPALNDKPQLEEDPEDITPDVDGDTIPNDDIVARYHGYRWLSFWFPGQRVKKPKPVPVLDVFCRAFVCLDHYELQGHGPIPSSAKENILVFFFHNKWKVWVSIPYLETRRRLPQLPHANDIETPST